MVYATYSAQATTMKRSIGNAKVSIEPPKVHALPAGSAITVFTPDPFLLFGSAPDPDDRALYYKA